MGDIVGIIKILVASNPEINFNYLHFTDKGEYRISHQEKPKNPLEVDSFNDNDLLDRHRQV